MASALEGSPGDLESDLLNARGAAPAHGGRVTSRRWGLALVAAVVGCCTVGLIATLAMPGGNRRVTTEGITGSSNSLVNYSSSYSILGDGTLVNGVNSVFKFGGLPGYGVDLINGVRKLPILALDYENTKEYDIETCKFDIPADIQIDPRPGKHFPVRKAYVFTSFQEYLSQVNQWRGSGSGVAGFFTWSDQVRETYRDYFARGYIVVIVQTFFPFYEASLPDEFKVQMNKRATAALMSLDEEYSFDAYSRFIDEYGDFYVASAQFGGVLELQSIVKSDYLKKYTRGEVQKQVSDDLDFQMQKAGSHEPDEEYLKSKVGERVTMHGGAPSEYTLPTWKAWLETICSAPAVLMYNSVRMSKIAPQEQRIKSSLNKATDQYFGAWTGCQNDGCIANGQCNMAGMCQCVPQFGGQSCNTPTVSGFLPMVTGPVVDILAAYQSATADVDGNGVKDVVTCSTDAAVTTVKLSVTLAMDPQPARGGSEESGFQKALAWAYTFTAPAATNKKPTLLLADFDGDSLIDIAVVDALGRKLHMFPGYGDGTFNNATTPINLFSRDLKIPHQPQAQDLNKDGRADLIWTTQKDTGAYFSALWDLQRDVNGTMHFVESVLRDDSPRVSGDMTLYECLVEDFNQDGTPELVYAQVHGLNLYHFADVKAMRSTVTQLHSTASGKALSVATSDFNNDGKPDIVFGSVAADYLSVALFDEHGFFEPVKDVAIVGDITPTVAAAPYKLIPGDFDHDGKQDCLFASLTGEVYIVYGAGTGTWRGSLLGGLLNTIVTGPHSIFAVDLNKDGFDDLVVEVASKTSVNFLSALQFSQQSKPSV